MSLRNFARSAALTIPRLRRFYEDAQRIRAERDRLAAACAELRQDLDRLQRELERAAAARDEAQRAADAATAERERIELELYVLRSDFQRAVAASEKIRARLARSEQALEALRGTQESARPGKSEAGHAAPGLDEPSP